MIDEQFIRRKEKALTTAGQTPEVAPSDDHTDGSWSVYHVYDREICINKTDKKVWMRMGTSIVEIATIEEVTALIQALTWGATYLWANETEKTAQTGMTSGERGYQVDEGALWEYNGTSWVQKGEIEGQSVTDIRFRISDTETLPEMLDRLTQGLWGEGVDFVDDAHAHKKIYDPAVEAPADFEQTEYQTDRESYRFHCGQSFTNINRKELESVQFLIRDDVPQLMTDVHLYIYEGDLPDNPDAVTENPFTNIPPVAKKLNNSIDVTQSESWFTFTLDESLTLKENTVYTILLWRGTDGNDLMSFRNDFNVHVCYAETNPMAEGQCVQISAHGFDVYAVRTGSSHPAVFYNGVHISNIDHAFKLQYSDTSYQLSKFEAKEGNAYIDFDKLYFNGNEIIFGDQSGTNPNVDNNGWRTLPDSYFDDTAPAKNQMYITNEDEFNIIKPGLVYKQKKDGVWCYGYIKSKGAWNSGEGRGSLTCHGVGFSVAANGIEGFKYNINPNRLVVAPIAFDSEDLAALNTDILETGKSAIGIPNPANCVFLDLAVKCVTLDSSSEPAVDVMNGPDSVSGGNPLTFNNTGWTEFDGDINPDHYELSTYPFILHINVTTAAGDGDGEGYMGIAFYAHKDLGL